MDPLNPQQPAQAPVEAPKVPTVPTQVVESTGAIATEKAQPEQTPKDARLEQLERRERAIRRQAQELKALKAQLDAQAKPQAPASPQFDKAQFLKDPLSYGLTPEELSNGVLGVLNQDPMTVRMRQLEARIEELSGGHKSIEEKLSSAQAESYEQAKRQITSEVKSLVESSQEFSLVKASGSTDAVTALIEQVYKDEGVLMNVQEATREIEEILLEDAIKLAQLEKVQAKLRPKAEPKAEGAASNAADDVKAELDKRKIQLKSKTREPYKIEMPTTLTNQMVQMGRPQTMSAVDRKARLIERMKSKI